MTCLLHHLPALSARRTPDACAVRHHNVAHTYASLQNSITAFANSLLNLGLERRDRVAIFLPKQLETVAGMFGAVAAGGVFVPVNPILKPAQIEHILRDCSVRVLVTSSSRLEGLLDILPNCQDLRHIVLVDQSHISAHLPAIELHDWNTLLSAGHPNRGHRVIDTDMAAILYTSGSTGKPKGVVLSHRNMVTGAHSVAEYLENKPEDRLLAVLPFSFDYGFSQLSTAFHVGASVTLIDYLFARDIIVAVARDKITGLAGVPPLWSQLADLSWSPEAAASLRYFTNSGGAMPGSTLTKLRTLLPNAQPFLMYGLTEAFRSTYLPPSEIDRRPGSMGKAIPNAEILVVHPDGTPCAPHEPGELVHRGSLVALGYWNDPEKTATRYKQAPGQPAGIVTPELAVWSGDTVKMDEDGYLYFVGRRDEMIKTSGYRVSPNEIEEVIFATGLVADVVAVGVPHPTLGQAIVVIAAAAPGSGEAASKILDECKQQLPTFMVPIRIEYREALPRNPNGKYDRSRLAAELSNLFT